MIYDSFASDLTTGNIAPVRDAFYVMLVKDYTFSSSHATRKDVEASEVTAGGYSEGGKTTMAVVKKVGGDTTIVFSDVQWDIVNTLTATGGVVYKHSGGPSSEDPLVTFLDFGKAVSCTDSTFTCHFASGLGISAR